jgi:hypothetical protein
MVVVLSHSVLFAAQLGLSMARATGSEGRAPQGAISYREGEPLKASLFRDMNSRYRASYQVWTPAAFPTESILAER